MASGAHKNDPCEGVAKGLNSPELRKNATIPFVDEYVELDHVRTAKAHEENEREDTEPLLPKGERKIHLSDLGPVRSPNTDTIVVDTPEGTLYITLDPESKSKPTSPSTESTDLSELSPGTSKAFGASESRDLIAMESGLEQRRTGLRRNSISMPTLQNLESEVLKQQYAGPEDGVSSFGVLCGFFFYTIT
ncbi:unnamed protein product, partial [Iphiclides podalirius]